MEYESLSDFEVNKLVAEALGLKVRKSNMPYYSESHRIEQIGAEGVTIQIAISDYCNNPSDAWPIITKYKISIDWCNDSYWSAIGNDGSEFSCTNHAGSNPLRCAMIVYLKMQENDHANSN